MPAGTGEVERMAVVEVEGMAVEVDADEADEKGGAGRG